MPMDPAVDAWFAARRHPQEAVMRAVREVILAADPRITETIKWQAPTFVYRGNIASFYPKAKAHASLMFHRGAELPDPEGLLEGEGDVSRVAKFADAAELDLKRDALQALVRAWITARDAD